MVKQKNTENSGIVRFIAFIVDAIWLLSLFVFPEFGISLMLKYWVRPESMGIRSATMAIPIAPVAKPLRIPG